MCVVTVFEGAAHTEGVGLGKGTALVYGGRKTSPHKHTLEGSVMEAACLPKGSTVKVDLDLRCNTFLWVIA